MSGPVQLAAPVPGFVRVPGLYVDSKTLKGTLLVFFNNVSGTDYDAAAILHTMRLVNRHMANGYGIDLNIRENTFFEAIHTSFGWVTVSLVRTMEGNECVGAAACYSREWNSLRMTPDAPSIYVVHELLHKLGLGHSGSPRSLMFWNQGARPSRDLRTYPEEIKRLVEAYR